MKGITRLAVIKRAITDTKEREEFTSMNIKILRITHPVLGEIKGIIPFGLDYTIYLADGEMIEVNAEESPGMMYEHRFEVSDWTFDVDVTGDCKIFCVNDK